ncbi:hypothetical protein N8T08_007344 [Aspergillus melleus]|uniref:Uncharacterized protein n=1 Tax=Aspergillus melleus TaxID=138277 RepID=A0ACC3AXL7_9EURO|nr:hypothetical protein N8T08_007344 [Aspergillus melleus]
MVFLRPQPTEAAFSTSSNGSSSAQYTPVSDGSEEEHVPSSGGRPPPGSLKLQTDLDLDEDFFSDAGSDPGYESYGDARRDSEQSSLPKYSMAEEREVVKKFDRKLIPFLALLYMLSFLDRSNIGNAKIAGLMEDLKLSSSQYEWLLTAFYITYILFEWMTLMYRVVPPHIYIALCVCGWGLVATFQSLATSFSVLVFLRALLGITEAAFGPGVPFYLSLFYKREELAFRNGLFISAAPLASSFASSLAWVIVKLSSNGPIAPWRTLFLVEGFPGVIVAVFAWLLIPDSPGSASMGYSSLTSQALSAPPYLLAFIIVLITAYISDRNRSRSTYLILHAVISSTAYLIIALTGHFHTHLPTPAHVLIRYLCVYPATAGFFSAITLIMTWTMDNRVAKEGKGASIAVMNAIGQCGPLLGTRLYPASDRPWYVRGMATCSFFMMVVAGLALLLRVLLQRANRRVQRKGEEEDTFEMQGGGHAASASAGAAAEESEVLMGDRASRRGVTLEYNVEERFTYIV